MAVGLKVDMFWYPVGTGDFLHSFFSTICFNLENSAWGNRFPTLMNELYSGDLDHRSIDPAIKELITVRNELKNFPPEKVVWDMDDLTKRPPWGGQDQQGDNRPIQLLCHE